MHDSNVTLIIKPIRLQLTQTQSTKKEAIIINPQQKIMFKNSLDEL